MQLLYKTSVYSAWGLLRVCAACPTPRLNQSYELRPPWEQHLRYVPHRVHNGDNSAPVHHQESNTVHTAMVYVIRVILTAC